MVRSAIRGWAVGLGGGVGWRASLVSGALEQRGMIKLERAGRRECWGR